MHSVNSSMRIDQFARSFFTFLYKVTSQEFDIPPLLQHAFFEE